MRNEKFNNFGYALTSYLGKYLPNEGGLSINTIYSYRDTFKLFILYLRETGINTEKIEFQHFTRENLNSFLDWLESDRNCTVSTRNIRLAALHAFARYLQIDFPELAEYSNNILSLRKKKEIKNTIGYLSTNEINWIMIEAKQTSNRDFVLLSLLYETGCRAQELCD